jgi:hypothetical protein
MTESLSNYVDVAKSAVSDVAVLEEGGAVVLMAGEGIAVSMAM